MSYRLLLIFIGLLALGGCASVPQTIAGDYAPVSLDAARSGKAGATPVRWGGEIITTEPREQETCFFVLAQPLDSQARPKLNAQSTGRFVACKQGFYDPEVYHQGSELTVTGTLNGTVQHKVGKFDYTYVNVTADSVYLWPARARYVPVYGPMGSYYDPFFGGAWGSWGPWGYGPWYPSTRVIVVPNKAPAPDKH